MHGLSFKCFVINLSDLLAFVLLLLHIWTQTVKIYFLIPQFGVCFLEFATNSVKIFNIYWKPKINASRNTVNK